MSDVGIGFVILIIIVIVLAVKLSSLKEQLVSRSNQEARTIFERWKAAELRTEVAREVDLSISAIKAKAENDIRMAKQEARLDFQQWKTDETLRIRQDASNRSSAVHVGKITEHLIPWFLDGAFDPRDIRFIGSPIDLIVFHGLSAGYVEAIHFIEVKSGKTPKMSPREELVRGAAASGRVAYSVVHLKPEENDAGFSLSWLGDTPSTSSTVMNDEIKDLIEKHREATNALEFETASEFQVEIFENFGMSVANLADQVAILRKEIEVFQRRKM